jgi:hypothetical protein
MKLQRVATYAANNKKSLAWGYKQIQEGKVKVKIIDGTKFIEVKTKK